MSHSFPYNPDSICLYLLAVHLTTSTVPSSDLSSKKDIRLLCFVAWYLSGLIEVGRDNSLSCIVELALGALLRAQHQIFLTHTHNVQFYIFKFIAVFHRRFFFTWFSIGISSQVPLFLFTFVLFSGLNPCFCICFLQYLASLLLCSLTPFIFFIHVYPSWAWYRKLPCQLIHSSVSRDDRSEELLNSPECQLLTYIYVRSYFGKKEGSVGIIN